MKKVIRIFGMFLLVLFFMSGFTPLEKASAIAHCGIFSTNPDGVATVNKSLNPDGVVGIQCSGSYTWSSIRSTATYTNSTTRVNNYNNTGGYTRARDHFNQMPGTTVYRPDGVMTKTSEGKTVTLYKSTSTTQPSLSYPNGLKIDKIRYYD